MANRGLKRICASCGIKFYDMAKQPIICPACGAKFTGEVEVKSRRSRSSIVPDTVKREDIEEKNQKASPAEVEEDDDDIESLGDDLSLEDLEEGDDSDSDDDLSDLDGDIEIDLDEDDL